MNTGHRNLKVDFPDECHAFISYKAVFSETDTHYHFVFYDTFIPQNLMFPRIWINKHFKKSPSFVQVFW